MENALVSLLKNQGHEVIIERLPYRLIYKQPAFVAQFAHLIFGRPQCPVAASQIRKRFCLRSGNRL